MKSTKSIVTFAFPAIIENFLQMLVGITDTMIVTRISLSAVAAVSLASNVITVYQAIFIALGTIISSLFAKTILNKKKKERQGLIDASVKLTLILGVLLGLFSLLFSFPLMRGLGARGESLQLAVIYFGLVGGLSVLLGLMTTFSALLRASGNTKTPMWVSFWTNLINVLLSALFIFVFHLGVLGTALGAVLARLIGSIYLHQKLQQDQPSKNFWRTPLTKGLIRLSLPAAAERLAMRLGDLMIMMIVVHFGARVFAGNAIGESITQFNYMPVFGMGTVTVILVAQEYALKNSAHIKNYIQKTYWLSTAMMLVIGGGLLIFSRGLNAFFTTDKVALGASHTVILYSFLATFFVTGASTYTAAFQGIGNPKLPFYATTFGMFALRLSLGALFGIVFQMGLEGVWLAVLLDNLFRFAFLKIKFDQAIKMK